MTKTVIVSVFAFMFICLAGAGCGSEEKNLPGRTPLTLRELVVRVDSQERRYFLSDKSGGFLTGSIHPGSAGAGHCWSVDGKPEVVLAGGGIDGSAGGAEDFARVFPDRVQIFHRGGGMLEMEPLEHVGRGMRALAVNVRGGGSDGTFLALVPAEGFARTPSSPGGVSSWRRKGSSVVLYLMPGGGAEIREGGVAFRATEGGSVLLVHADREIDGNALHALQSGAPALALARGARMERLLNRSYLRFSDPEGTKAVSWIKLSLDALVQEGDDTLAVARLPWDGAYSGRDNAQSIAGIGLASADYGTTAAILRSLARAQDTVRSHATYGRIPERMEGTGRQYGAVDAAPWFVRELFEHITYANDTVLARLMYPVIERSIRGASRYNANGSNLLVHEAGEVAMGGSRFAAGGGKGVVRGGRYAAVELQLLWYFQQLIGSYIADYVGDGSSARQWEQGARTTTAQFDRSFIDTTRKLLYDHLDERGRGVLVRRPNAFFALEVLGDEAVQQNMLRELMASLLYTHGVGTLGSSEPGFTPYLADPASASGSSSGPVWTSLLGQATYALTRYDREDLSYRLTQFLLNRVLEEDVVGAAPEMFDVRPRKGEQKIRSGGGEVSLTGMAELIRAMYQDYFGIHVDAPSMVLRTEPKLPREFTDVEFTVYVGSSAVEGSYHRGAESDRITMFAQDLAKPLKWSFIWILAGGDAWRGTFMLHSGDRVSVVLTPGEIAAFRGTQGVLLEDQWKINGFSRRDDVKGLGFADPGR